MTPHLAVTLLLSSATIAGLWPGAYRPLSGLAIFLAGSAVFPALPWHVGLPDVSVGFAFLGAWLRGRAAMVPGREGRTRGSRWLSSPGVHGLRSAALATSFPFWRSIVLVPPRSGAFGLSKAPFAEHATLLFAVNSAGGVRRAALHLRPCQRTQADQTFTVDC